MATRHSHTRVPGQLHRCTLGRQTSKDRVLPLFESHVDRTTRCFTYKIMQPSTHGRHVTLWQSLITREKNPIRIELEYDYIITMMYCNIPEILTAKKVYD